MPEVPCLFRAGGKAYCSHCKMLIKSQAYANHVAQQKGDKKYALTVDWVAGMGGHLLLGEHVMRHGDDPFKKKRDNGVSWKVSSGIVVEMELSQILNFNADICYFQETTLSAISITDVQIYIFMSLGSCPDLPEEEATPEAEICKWEVEAHISKDALEGARHKIGTNSVFAAGEAC
ncbi:hypothetical protein BTVI_125899 [Pitangus sulphuratus]|nr:hypothetical protein BTVI_125899 [Pitangus sulphuratus]